MSSTPIDSAPRHTNRLALETSPYLLQHQHNPVDWYPWGEEAFERARKEDKPIFLSVGYSTCYWCHVMERQSFENEAVAAVMNELFVNIKVDREERPDVDQVYMTAVQVLTRHGGWPMSVWMLPDRRPFYGGTYYPPHDMQGRPGFVTLLRALEDAYRNRRADVEQSAGQITDILRQLAQPPSPDGPVAIDAAFVDTMVGRSAADYEPRFGGFGSAPKFPRETLLELLLKYLDDADLESKISSPVSEISNSKSQIPPAASSIRNPQSEIRNRLRHTLDAMAHGGIRDHLGGGFHRYSTDSKWLVPHFEIMLYDNAMLGWVYADASRQFGDQRYAQVARDVLDFVLVEMTSPEGAFYTALDAEVDAEEGQSYLWTPREIAEVLGDDARHFNHVYGLDRGPNFADPHHGSGVPDKNILYLAEPLIDGKPALLDANLRTLRRKLYERRRTRKQPLLDTKVLTSWNALMIRAFAHAGKVLNEPRYVQAAVRAMEFLLAQHLHGGGRESSASADWEGGALAGALFRTSRDGKRKHAGCLDDYAFLAQAMLALEAAGAGEVWRIRAGELASAMLARFGDADRGGLFYTGRDASDLIVRQKSATDSPLPSGNAVAALVLLQLGRVDEARRIIAAFVGQMQAQGEAMSSMVHAALSHVRLAGPFTAGAREPGPQAQPPKTPEQLAMEIVRVSGEWAGPRELRVRLRIAPGYHINSHEPVLAGAGLVTTEIALGDRPDVGRIDYPAGELLRTAFVEQSLRVYSGEVVATVHFARDQDSRSTVQVNIRYQACDESACLPAVSKRAEINLS